MTQEILARNWTDNEEEKEKVLNKMYKNDVKGATRYTRWLLELIGVWGLLKKRPGPLDILFSKIVIFTCLALIGFVMLPCLMHMLIKEKNTSIKIKLLGPISLRITNIVKYFSIIYRRDIIKICIEHLENDWMMAASPRDRQIMTKNANLGRAITILCIVFMFTGGMSYHTIMPLWRGKKINSFNRTIRPLVYPGYDIFVDSQSSPEYEIIFSITCLSACVTYAVITAVCSLAAIFVTHACGQIQIIISRLETLFDGATETIIKNRVSVVIKYHVRVLSLAEKIETVFSEICLMEMVASTLIICLLEYYCMTEWENSDTVAIVTYFLLLMSLSFNIFIFCHIGELLKEQCTEVGKAIYMIDWYRLPSRTGQALIMVIAMSNYPRKLTAGRMMDLSVASFGAVIKTSVMYLNMLKAMDN